jgi:glycosyltransferase involved in cell wall biosynthesis
VLSHPGTGPFVQHAARALHEAGLLAAYVTTFHYDRNTVLGRILRGTLGLVMRDPDGQLARREITEVPQELVRSHPLPEMIRMAAVKGASPITTDRIWEVTEKWFDRMVARQHLRGAAAVYAYEHAALATFEAQKRQGGKCIYEMPTSHHRLTAELVQPEFRRFPEAETARDIHLRKLAPRRNERKDRELFLADLVIANSTFARTSLVKAGFPADRVAVIPLGAPPVAKLPPQRVRRPFIFLAAGNLTVRKGIPYLLEAWRSLGCGSSAELWMVGNMVVPASLTANLPGRVVILPTVPRDQLFEIYRRAGALVFPSLCEGFGMVITEAMSQGLPVITTPNTGGGDLIENGRNGLLVPIRDAERLAESMQWCLDHPDDMTKISFAALDTAARWQWGDYRAALGAAVLQFLDESRASQMKLPDNG